MRKDIFTRHCDTCGELYTGKGKRFCSKRCFGLHSGTREARSVRARTSWACAKPSENFLNPTERRCNGCNTVKPLSCFQRNKNAPLGYWYKCKDCLKADLDSQRSVIRKKPVTVTESRCNVCKQTKSADQFGRNFKRHTGVHYVCRVCVSQDARQRRAKRNLLRRTGERPLADAIYCTKCKASKPKERFSPSYVRDFNGTKGTCNDCVWEYRQKLNIKNPEARRNRYLKTAFGITGEAYDALLKKQKGVCAICKQHDKTDPRTGGRRYLSVDHDHDNGKIRGLLCHSCNVLLGFARDNIKILEQAARYLKSFS